MASKCKVFNQGNILFQQGKVTRAGWLRDISSVCNVALSQELSEDNFSFFLNTWLCTFYEDDFVHWKTTKFQVYNTTSSSGRRKGMSLCPYSSGGKRPKTSLPVGVTVYLTVASHRGVWLLVAPPVDRENSEGFLRGRFAITQRLLLPFDHSQLLWGLWWSF